MVLAVLTAMKPHATRPRLHVVVIHDDPHHRDTICRGLRLFGHHGRAVPTSGALEAVATTETETATATATETVDCVLVDLDSASVALVDALRLLRPAPAMLVITGNLAGATRALGDRAVPVLSKPFDAATLDAALRSAASLPARGAW